MRLNLNFLLVFFLTSIVCQSQNWQQAELPIYYQKVLVLVEQNKLEATRLLDSLSIYGYVPGYDTSAINSLQWVGKFQGHEDQEKEAVFIPLEKVDTIRIKTISPNGKVPEQTFAGSSAAYGFVLMGENIASSAWLYDLFYSELLDFAEAQFTTQHLSLVVYPLEGKHESHYRIVEVVKTENGKVEISSKLVDYEKPTAPKILESSKAEISKEKDLVKLKEKLEGVKNLELKSQCVDPGFAQLIMVPDDTFYYNYQCLRENRKTVSEHPITLSDFVLRLYYKYLYKR